MRNKGMRSEIRKLCWFFGAALALSIVQCHKAGPQEDTAMAPPAVDKLFTLMPAGYTGIDFQNTLTYTEEFNPYTYRSFFNGGGVGLGDINNDGLIDVYLCGNQQPSRLYLNKGNFKFEDITDKAGVACEGVWSTGVTLADVNGDGWLDIYVCKSGKPGGNNRYNELFINNHNLTFTESAKSYGLADMGLSVHAAFFDYDKDGDLDCYLLNNSIRTVGGYDLRKNQRDIRDTLGGNKLYRNDGDHFTDVSAKAGIYGSAIGFGLGVTIGDLNRDGWDDIYVSNDFFERDYLYINNRNGTFTESLEQQIPEISMGSMGADMADINNDGYPEIFVTEMLPESEARIKTKASFENWNKYQANVANGYYHQFPRNVLQLNNGNNTFSEIGRLAGVHATDWSWGALMVDLDNDGWRDIFVANGIYKDLLDQDYINYFADPNTIRTILKKENAVIKRLVDSIPSEPLPNYAYHNNGNLTFANLSADWGLNMPSFSNGSAYGDLDNDGDLDLVVNNVNMLAFVYRNETDSLKKDNHYLKVSLQGTGKNTAGIGSQVTLKCGGKLLFGEVAPMRGFQSTVDSRLNFGLGNITVIDSLIVNWPDNRISVMTHVPVNQQLVLKQSDAVKGAFFGPDKGAGKPVFQEISGNSIPNFQHKENDFSDFDRDRLIFHMLSAEGPKLSKGDVNGDGLEDFYVGNAKDSPGGLFIQEPNGSFRKAVVDVIRNDSISEDEHSVLFDADGDGDIDLYVASGGNEFPTTSTGLIDRLYLNDGKGNFTKSPQVLPTFNFESSSTVRSADYDKDGDSDLFVGIRLEPFVYGAPCNGYILENDGKGYFKNVTPTLAPGLLNAGMITDAQWVDIDRDGDPDLVVTGEYMPLKVFRNDRGSFTDITAQAGMGNTKGWWNCLTAADVDGDGDLDLIAGNHGLNSRFKASIDKPVSMYVNDFDGNGSVEQIICAYNGDASYPMALRHDLVAQIPSLKKKYLYYKDYKEQTIQKIFRPEQMQNTIQLDANQLQSCVFINDGKGHFAMKPLPVEAQFSPVYAILADDFDHDGREDLLIGGNFSRSKPETGIYEGSYGLFLKGDGKGGFAPVTGKKSRFNVRGDIRDLMTIRHGKEKWVLVAMNNAALRVFKY